MVSGIGTANPASVPCAGTIRHTSLLCNSNTKWKTQKRYPTENRSSIMAKASTCQVAESLTVFSLKPELDDEQISEVIDTCWSLQYMVRGPVCGSAGPVITGIVPQDTADSLEQFNNCILFRYASEKNMNDFLNHLKTKYMLKDVAEEKTTAGVATITFRTSVPNELESIFRRGAEWEEGYELILGLHKTSESTDDDDVEEFLQLTEALAASSAYGAVQAAHGPVLHVIHHNCNGGQFACDTIFTARFPPNSNIVESFLQSPAMQAVIQGDERSPVSLSWGLIMEVSPGQSNESLQ